jgi:hypothetical protein
MSNFRNKTRYYLALLLVLGLTPVVAAAAQTTTYKWLDEQGNVTYGDHPPKGVVAEEIRISTGTSSSRASNSPAASQAPASAAAAPGKNTSTTAAQGVGPEKARQLCQQARSNLEVLQNNALIRQTDEQGNVTILDDSQKQEQIDTANKIIKDFCK